MGKVTQIAALSQGQAGGVNAEIALGQGKKRGVVKIDWEVNVVGAGATVTGSVSSRLFPTDTPADTIDINGNKLSFTEADFGSPAAVGTYSIVREVWITPYMTAIVSNQNDLTNVFRVYLSQE